MAIEVQTQSDTELQSSGTEVLESMTPAERTAWNKTGELPAKPKVGESTAPPATEAKSEPAEKSVEPAPAPDTGKTAQDAEKGKGEDHVSRADKRILQLLAERKALRAENEELKRPKAAAPVEKEPEPTTGKPSAPFKIPDALKAKIASLTGNADQFETYEDMVAALGMEVVNAMVPEMVKQVLKQEAEAREAAKEQEKVTKAWMKTVDAAVEKHPDFGKVVDTPRMTELIPGDSTLNAIIVDSEMGGEILYHLASHQDEAERIAALGPLAQAREIFRLEASLRGSSAPVSTEVPPPPKIVGTGETTPLDPVAKALKDGATDQNAFRRYVSVANHEDLEKSRKG